LGTAILWEGKAQRKNELLSYTDVETVFLGMKLVLFLSETNLSSAEKGCLWRLGEILAGVLQCCQTWDFVDFSSDDLGFLRSHCIG